MIRLPMTLRIPYRRQNPASSSWRFAHFRSRQFVCFTVAKTQLQLATVANKSPSPSFRRNRDDSAPKRFWRHFDFRPPFAFLIVAKTQPHRRDGSLALDRDGSFTSPLPSFRRNHDDSDTIATLHPLRRFWWRFILQRRFILHNAFGDASVPDAFGYFFFFFLLS